MRDLLPIVVGGHTVDLHLLAPGGIVLDAGCRDFHFARVMAHLGCNVIALDPDPSVPDPCHPRIAFHHLALADVTAMRELILTADAQARYLAPANVTVQAERVAVEAMTLTDLMTTFGVRQFDAVKLDIEGAEMDVLRSWPGPVARQISIEFHQHCNPRPDAEYEAIFAHLGQWYDVVQHTKEARYCCAPNWWDTLLVLTAA